MLKMYRASSCALGRGAVDSNGECATGDLFPVPVLILHASFVPAAAAAALSKLRVEQIHLHITYVRGE